MLSASPRLNEALRALRGLVDQQNGPPLVRNAKEWQAAYDEAHRVLALYELPEDLARQETPVYASLGIAEQQVTENGDYRVVDRGAKPRMQWRKGPYIMYEDPVPADNDLRLIRGMGGVGPESRAGDTLWAIDCRLEKLPDADGWRTYTVPGRYEIMWMNMPGALVEYRDSAHPDVQEGQIVGLSLGQRVVNLPPGSVLRALECCLRLVRDGAEPCPPGKPGK